LLVQTPRLGAQSGPVVWAVPSLTRDARDEAAGHQRATALWAARGEYESFQVIVRGPAGGLNNANVPISDLMGERRRTSKARRALDREPYPEIAGGSPARGGSTRPLGPGWYPDALIPLATSSGGSVRPSAMRAVPFELAPSTN